VEDYFFDNQVLEITKDEVIAVGYKQTWKISKSSGKASKAYVGISEKYIGNGVIMP
jgi:hypothetical protein